MALSSPRRSSTLLPRSNRAQRRDCSGSHFTPASARNRRFFVYYTRPLSLQLQSVSSEYAASSSNPNQADAFSERILLVVNQPFDNHNGGQLAFGPDAFLYIGLGDGGGEGDPQGNGQSLQTLLGKILRIDVDGAFAPGKQYAIPADNPFTPPSGLPEIWAYGLRNPWRFSFDRVTSKLFAGDVGQNSFEEVDIITRAGNFGWNKMEASHCYTPGSSCGTAGLILPIMEDAHNASGRDDVIGGVRLSRFSRPRGVGRPVLGAPVSAVYFEALA